LHDVIVDVRNPDRTTRCAILERETEGNELQPDPSFVATCNRLGAGGWMISPVTIGGLTATEVPQFLMKLIREKHSELILPGTGTWATYWLSRRMPTG
jgi:hypothetical protein